MAGSARHDLKTVCTVAYGAARERSLTMKKKGKKDDAKVPKKGK
jgi:hypothetical protein